MQATRTEGSPSRSLTARSVSKVPKPSRPEASRNWGCGSCHPAGSAWMYSRVGTAAWPVIIRASPQVFFSSVARKLEDRESPMKPVRGDLAMTANLLEVVRRLPTKGLAANIKGFSGPKGSAPAGQYLYSR